MLVFWTSHRNYSRKARALPLDLPFPGARIRTQLLSFFYKQVNLVEFAFLAIHTTYAVSLGPILEERVGEIVKRV